MINLIPVSLSVQFSGESNYKPEGIEYNKWYRVISTHSRKRINEFEGKKKEVVEIFFWVIGDNGKMTKVIHNNCFVRVNDNEKKSEKENNKNSRNGD
jgi:hypothetical protein